LWRARTQKRRPTARRAVTVNADRMTPLPSLPPSDRAALLIVADDPYGKTLIKRPARAPNAVSGIGRGFLWQCRTQKRRPTARRAVTVIDDRMTPLPSLPPSDRAALLIVADDPYGKKLIIPPGFVKTCSSYRQCHSASAGPALLLHAGWRRAVRADTAPTQPKCDEYLWNFTPPTMQKHTRRPPLRKIMFISFKSVWAKGQRCPKIHASH
jgi:hypothetical protein